MQAIVTYCLFETIEVLKLCFFIYDRDKNGYVEQDQLQFFISGECRSSVGERKKSVLKLSPPPQSFAEQHCTEARSPATRSLH